MKVLHIWGDYSPNLFDKSHSLCLTHGLKSEIVCRSFIENGAERLPGTISVRQVAPGELNSEEFGAKLHRVSRRFVDNFRFAKLVINREKSFKPDVLHIHFGTTGVDLLKWRGLPNKPIVLSFYGYDASAALNTSGVRKKYQELFLRNPVVHVLSREVADRMALIGCRPELIVVGNLPADVEKIPEIGCEQVGITRYLIPARFVEKKGHIVLLAAFKRLQRNKENVRLTCFGYGPADWLRKLVSDMKLDSVVRVIDNGQSSSFITDYIEMLRRHDVILAPSIRSSTGDDEGGPALTIVMAQAAGKPVIVSDFPGSERSVTSGSEGIVIRANDEEMLYRAMIELADNISEWSRMGAAGRRRVLEDFSEKSYWLKLRDWYVTALKQPS